MQVGAVLLGVQVEAQEQSLVHFLCNSGWLEPQVQLCHANRGSKHYHRRQVILGYPSRQSEAKIANQCARKPPNPATLLFP